MWPWRPKFIELTLFKTKYAEEFPPDPVTGVAPQPRIHDVRSRRCVIRLADIRQVTEPGDDEGGCFVTFDRPVSVSHVVLMTERVEERYDTVLKMIGVT